MNFTDRLILLYSYSKNIINMNSSVFDNQVVKVWFICSGVLQAAILKSWGFSFLKWLWSPVTQRRSNVSPQTLICEERFSPWVAPSAPESPRPARGIHTPLWKQVRASKTTSLRMWAITDLSAESRKPGNQETSQFCCRNSQDEVYIADTHSFPLTYFPHSTMWSVVWARRRAEVWSVVLLSGGTEGEADGDGEDGDGCRERHQQAAAQHSLHRGKPQTSRRCVTWVSQ